MKGSCPKAIVALKIASDAVRKSIDILLSIGIWISSIHANHPSAIIFSSRNKKAEPDNQTRSRENVSCRISDDPELASPQLVKIWKTSGLMSAQFDVIELLANEELYRFPLNTELEIYKLVDKCVRIFRPPDNPSRIVLKAPFNFHARIRAFDKTIQIIPTVLIENALKYAIPGSPIYVELSREDDWVILSVQNDSIGTQPLTENVFQPGDIEQVRTRTALGMVFTSPKWWRSNMRQNFSCLPP